MTHDQSREPLDPATRLPSILVACEDPVLLRAVERVISWQRPHWKVRGAVGPEEARAELSSAVYQVVVVHIELGSPVGVETLRIARTSCPHVLRVVYSTAPCPHSEVTLASEQVTGAAAVGCLIGALDRVIDGAHAPRVSAEVVLPTSV